VCAALATLTFFAAPLAADRTSCLRSLSQEGARFRTAKQRGIAIGVEISDRVLGGVKYTAYKKAPFVIDCSLAVSLARSGVLLRSLGVEEVTYSSAYQRRKIRGTSRLSSHSFGLAIDLHTFRGARIGTLRVKDDYEQGLGDYDDCVGAPLTRGGQILRGVDCGLAESGAYRILLSPDYDAAHYNHFHVEARPWSDRTLDGAVGAAR